MKLSLFMNVLLISSLAFVAVGCGKDKKKKGNDPYYNYYGNAFGLGQQQITATGAQALANLNTYLNAAETNNNLVGPVNLVKQRFACTTDDFLGINFLPKVETCRYSQVASYVYALPGAQRIANPNLAVVLSPANGYIMGAVVQYGSVFTVDHVLPSAVNQTIQYTIDTNKHSAVNPIIVKDTAAKRIDSVISPLY